MRTTTWRNRRTRSSQQSGRWSTKCGQTTTDGSATSSKGFQPPTPRPAVYLDRIRRSSQHSGNSRSRVRENSSFAPPGLDRFPLLTKRLRPRLYSVAASRLDLGRYCSNVSPGVLVSRTLCEPELFLRLGPYG